MCGIFGGVGQKNRLLGLDTDEQLSLISCRGPDGFGFQNLDNYIVGHTLLAIQDPGNASQPMYSKSGRLLISFNGEIYNFKALMKSRSLSKLKTNSDTEVLVELIDQFGFEVTSELEGMFAFAVYNAETQVLTLGRDRFGEKPLFYANVPNGFFFGSNPIGVSKMAKVPIEISNERLAHYLKYQYLPEGTSVFTSVVQVPPGTLIHVDKKLEISTQEVKNRSVVMTQDFRTIFTESVRDCMVSDVPIGLALSGGVDSTVTLATISKLELDVSTFTLIMDDNSEDRIYAKRAAEQFHSAHYELRIEDNKLAETVYSVLSKQPLPFGDSSIVPTYVLAREAKKTVKVLISGDGADEVLSGYNYYRKYGQIKTRNWATFAKFMLLKWETYLREIYKKIDYSKVQTRKELELSLSIKSALELWNEDLACLSQNDLSKCFKSLEPVSKISRKRLETFEGIDSVMAWDQLTYLPGDILWKSDTAGMMASLEIRTPFLNTKVLDWSSRQRYSKTISKQSLMESYFGKDISPEYFSRKKSGFGAPLKRWFDNIEVKELYKDILGNPRSKVFDYINFQGAYEISARNLQFRWNLLALAIWLENNA
jgi:asparagine synthase (glutamine-hydrolysing)